jgi:hypothetical protein
VTNALLLISTAGLIRPLAGTGYAGSMLRMMIPPCPGHEAAPQAPYAGITLWRVSENRM